MTITKHNYLVRSARSCGVLPEAFRVAASGGRGPSWSTLREGRQLRGNPPTSLDWPAPGRPDDAQRRRNTTAFGLRGEMLREARRPIGWSAPA